MSAVADALSAQPGAPAPTILVVDDDESLLTLITLRLEASGFRVLTARNATDRWI